MNTQKRKVAVVMAAGCLAWAMTTAQAAPTTSYVGAGVTVVRAGGQAVIDNGGVICRASGPSIGGGCVDFPAPGTDGAGVQVVDADLGLDVAFQVCIDNNGDGICGGPQGLGSLECGDDIFFSHSDDGAFFNAVGPLPGSFRRGCPGGDWNGYVVMMCSGVHAVTGDDAHAHEATQGVISTTFGAKGFGDFCGGGGGPTGTPNPVVAKAYIVE